MPIWISKLREQQKLIIWSKEEYFNVRGRIKHGTE
jgi:hypothetical protein